MQNHSVCRINFRIAKARGFPRERCSARAVVSVIKRALLLWRVDSPEYRRIRLTVGCSWQA